MTPTRNVRLDWNDWDGPPMFTWTDNEADGVWVFATFTEAKDVALKRMRAARRRITSAIEDTRRATKREWLAS